MSVIKSALSRRTFLRRVVQIGAAIAIGRIPVASKATPAPQAGVYGAGPYGQGVYPAIRTFIPLIASRER